MATARDVATFLGYMAANYSEPDPVSNLRLQKLLYYAQVWSIVRRGVPLFDERIEAWNYGPVVPEVYDEYEREGGGIFVKIYGGNESELTDAEREIAGDVWVAYHEFSGPGLMKFIREDGVWAEAREGVPPGVVCTEEISSDLIKAHYEALDPVSAGA